MHAILNIDGYVTCYSVCRRYHADNYGNNMMLEISKFKENIDCENLPFSEYLAANKDFGICRNLSLEEVITTFCRAIHNN